MEEQRMIEVGIISASNLKDVNYISKMETYAVLTFPPYVEYTTQVDYKGGVNPRWDEKLGFLVPDSVLQSRETHVKVEIFTLSTLGPKFVCEASIPLSDLSMISQLNDPIYKRYPLKTNSGDYHGDLHVSFSLGEKVALQKGERRRYPIVTQFGQPSSPSARDTERVSYPSPTSKPSRVGFDLSPFTPTKPSSQYESVDPYDAHSKPSVVQPTADFSDPRRRTPPSGYDTPPPSPFTPVPSKPAKPTPPSYVEPFETFPPSYVDPLSSKPPRKPLPQPTPPSYVEPFETFPPSYVDPLSSKPPRKPLPQPTPPDAFRRQPPYGLPSEERDSISYSPIQPPFRAPPKLGTHGVNVPISRIDEQSGYGPGSDYEDKPSKFGTSRINVPISRIDEEPMKVPFYDQSGYGPAARHGYQGPATPFNVLFGSPLGKILLSELSRSMPYDRRYS